MYSYFAVSANKAVCIVDLSGSTSVLGNEASKPTRRSAEHSLRFIELRVDSVLWYQPEVFWTPLQVR